MSTLEYLRPTSIEQALEYLDSGVPIAGGTHLTPRRSELKRVVDLSELGLDHINEQGGKIHLGAATKLQTLAETQSLPETLKKTCQLEGGWNIRNMATIGGLIMSSDARSPLLTCLLALNPSIRVEPGAVEYSLNDLLDRRDKVVLITEILIEQPGHLLYEQVARTPKDFPIVCAAIAEYSSTNKLGITLGGFGSRPIMLDDEWSINGLGDQQKAEIQKSAIEEARKAYSDAGDLWASNEYRASIAGTLVKRLLVEVLEE
jgi:putative selenate reductase FAD-binding subunit